MGLILAAALFINAPVIAAESSEPPLSPQQELATFHFANENFTAELVASEPDVVAPVAIAWDADGRLFVAEMTDYPSGPVSGRIRLLDDRDGDGRYEHSTVFAEKIAFPNGVMAWNGGVMVTAAPDILFFKDTDGDGCADERHVMLTGFAEGNQQLRVNGLYWGLDNWIYGANGRSDGEARWADELTNRAVSIRRRDFRFRPDTKQFEAIAGHSQFGTAHDDWGNRFPVFNNIPIRHVIIEQRYLERQPLLAGIETVAPISAPEDKGRVYYLAPPTLLIPQASDYFTSACGPMVYRDDALGAEYRGNFFVCEPVHNLVQRRRLVPNGASFIAERVENGKEFLASTDQWFHPVFTATGPDGCLYVVDFYRKYVEHPQWVADELKNTTPWRAGEEHGRIWRIHPKDWKPKAAKPSLSRAKPQDLVKYLERENGWWRDTAQRLLVERQDHSVVAALEKIARKSPSPLARLHSLCTLDGLNALSCDLLLAALKDLQPQIREHAIRLAEQFLAREAIPNRRERSGSPTASSGAPVSPRQVQALTSNLSGLVDDKAPRVRFQLALTLGDMPEPRTSLFRLAEKGIDDPWQSLAILSSIGSEAWSVWDALARGHPDWLRDPSGAQAGFLEKLASLIGASARSGEPDRATRWLVENRDKPFGRFALYCGLDDGAKSNPTLRRQLDSSLDTSISARVSAGDIPQQAETIAASADSALPLRLSAIRVLGRLNPPGSHAVLRNLLLPENPPEAQAAAVSAVSEANNPVAAGFALDWWERYGSSTRRQLVAAATRSTALAHALLTGLERGKILPIEVDPSTRQALQKKSDDALRQRAEKLFPGAVSSDREQVARRFKPALQMTGDRRHGAEIFARACLQCHAMQGEGARVGPDLSGIAAQPRETMLMNILDPSRQVLPDFLSYTLVKTDGETLTGLVIAESAAGVSIRRPNLPDVTIQRSQIQAIRADGKSLMPDGLEQGMNLQDMADLLSFLRQPEAALLPHDLTWPAGKAPDLKK